MAALFRYFLVLPLLLVAGTAVHALAPPRPGEIEQLKATGEYEARRAEAERIGNHRIDRARLENALVKAWGSVSPRDPASKTTSGLDPLPAPPLGWKGMPSTGTIKTFALLIDFVDYPSTNTREFIHERLFGAGDPARYPAESLARFYDRSSYGQLSLYGGTTLGWYHAPYNRSAVPQTEAGREAVVKEALAHFKAQGHDFSQYDNDGDGAIDYFMVIWTGPDNGWGGFWWGWKVNFSDPTFIIDGKKLWAYSWQFEVHPQSTVRTFDAGPVIHETGHALGLPDYYDYDETKGPGGGVGGLDMMDCSWGDHNAFSKWVLGWLTPTVVANGSHTLTLNPSATSKDAVLIMPDITSGDLFSEFFIAQNRYRTGNDAMSPVIHPYGSLPADGMLIWHVDARLTGDGTNFIRDNSSTKQKLLRLMEADGLEEIEQSTISLTQAAADAGDYYSTGMSFGPGTSPSSAGYDGGYTGVTVSDIALAGEQITATFSVLPRARLAVSKSGNGSGVVAGAAGISCGDDCGHSYPRGETVTLTADPSHVSRFTGWSGEGCSGTGTCTILLNRDAAVTANFDLIPGATGNLAVNPGFEEGVVPWGEFSSGGYELVTRKPGWAANFSDWYALLGGYDDGIDSLSQDITIPAEASGATLRFRYNISTMEPPEDLQVYDQMGVLLVDPATGHMIRMLTSLTNLDATNGWTASSSFDLSEFRGRTVRLTFLARTDELNYTIFKVDDVEVSVTIGSAQGASVELPRTGQATCYNSAGVEIACAGTGQDGQTRLGAAGPAIRFSDNGDGTVTDTLTGLTWARDARTPGPTVCTPGEYKSWNAAPEYIACLNSNKYLGHDDWRLPNINELFSLIHRGASHPALPAGHMFTNVVADAGRYWSSSTRAYSTTGYAWYADIWEGEVSWDYKFAAYTYVWPVRGWSCGAGDSAVCLSRTGQTTSYVTGDDGALRTGGAWPEPGFTQNGDQTVTHNLTGLVWAKDAGTPGPGACAPGVMKTWQGALDFVACLNSNSYLGYNDWRLPNINELYSLADRSQYNPALPASHPFTNVQLLRYWSSTTRSAGTSSAWLMTLGDGGVGSDPKGYSRSYVWPVRGVSMKAVDGACGSANGATLTAAPSSGLCSSGSASDVSGGGPWTWTCNGANGGTAASCSAAIATHTLAVTVTGAGNVNGGLSCSTGTCTGAYNHGSSLVLYASPGVSSLFSGWSGGCTGISNCSLTMSADRNVTALFTAKPATVKIEGDTAAYHILGAALDTILSEGKTVRARAEVFTENVVMSSPVAIRIRGGYTDDGFVTRQAETSSVVDGSIKIRRGTLRVERIKIR